MTNSLGLTLLVAFIILEISLRLIRGSLHSRPKASNILLWAMVISPAIFLTVIDKWDWPSTLNASQQLPYSWFHLFFIGAAIIASVLAIRLGSRHHSLPSEQEAATATDKTIFKFGIFLLGIETYKQIFFGTVFTSYQWYLFPFQFCSVPLYVCLIAPWIKNKKLKEACYSFLAIYAFIAGAGVMAIPSGVFTQKIAICIHTMAWHGCMIVLAVYLLANRQIGTRFSQLRGGTSVLFFFIGLAIVFNLVVHYGFPSIYCNAFFISPWGVSSFPVLSTIFENAKLAFGLFWGWLIYFITYLIAFTIAGFIVFGASGLAVKLRNRVALAHATSDI